MDIKFCWGLQGGPAPGGAFAPAKVFDPGPGKSFWPRPAKFFDPAAGRAGPRQGRGLAGAYPGPQNSLGNTLVSRLNNDKNEIA